MQLQSFVTKIIEGIGGVVDPVEYALCQVLIPEEYKGFFQNKTELELAFDFEVAQENPQSEFVTFGSFILEQVLYLANQQAVSTVRFAEVERHTLAHPVKKMTDSLDINGKIAILDERHVMGAWAVFQFHTAFISDEKEEDVIQVWVNLITGDISETMKDAQMNIMYQTEPLYNYPMPVDLHFDKAYELAFAHVEAIANEQQLIRKQDPQLQQDIDRIESYYMELGRENNKKASRKGLSEDKKREIMSKTEAILIEKDKQVEEIKKKYHGHTEIELDHGIVYVVPLLQYLIEVTFRSERKQHVLYYNPITMQFDWGQKPVMAGSAT
ncbi:hypothetical protein [Aquibacillus salsiterrae]|uniref:Uncharacterized protein n=1 Tax=Aquibacillus salsiterrae TaxID=2950439 RepID=A0A9X3WEZ2_9BACI|nr:hypothetical protein [Aquibacillus salsiterrae]MDC3418572.1 hypothetical protein [Aquibacillus salsiterrae]